MKNKGNIVVHHGDSKPTDISNSNPISGHCHSVHRSMWMKKEFKEYTYLFDAMKNLHMCDIELVDKWENGMSFSNSGRDLYIGSSISIEGSYNNNPTAWGKGEI